MAKPIKLSPQAREQAQGLMLQAQLAQQVFQSFIKGCMAQLEIKGDWNLNTNTWQFEKLIKDGK